MSLIDEMKKKIAEGGSNRKEILFFAPDAAKRIRFLQELDSGIGIEFHSDFNANIMEPCQDPEEHEDCPHCRDGIKLREQFFWSVWDYDSNSVKLLNLRATGVTPIPAFLEYYETYGTMMDRDYKVKKVGKGMGGSFVVTPLDKEKFRNTKAKPFSEKKIREIIGKAYAPTVTDDDDDDEDEAPKKKKSSKNKATKKKKKKVPTLRETLDDLSFKELKQIGEEIGMSRKELRSFEDADELIDELMDNYDEDDLKDLVEDFLDGAAPDNYDDGDDDDDDEDDEDED